MISAPFHLTMPDRRQTSVVFATPHSGRDYSDAFLGSSILDEHTIRSSEDAFVEDLLDGVPALGAPLLAARAPRAFVDVNRGADELDPAVIDGIRASAHNPRVASGLGVIPRVVAGGRAIYSGKLPREEAEARIAGVWRPYHDCLHSLLESALAQFGEAILVDMHSMPHEAMDSIAAAGAKRPEIVIGDRFGAAAASPIVDHIEAAFAEAGFCTLRNAPFAGAYIAQTYGRPSRGMHAVQIEIDRSLYMNEREIRPNGNYLGFKRILGGILTDIAALGTGNGRMPLAAE
jgi:N-formylglutamate deformylase